MKFDLAAFLPYLLNRTGVRVAGAFGRQLKPHGLTIQKWRVIAALCHEPAQRVGALADLTSIDTWTVSRLARGLERQGLVERRRTGEDGRGVVVALSPRGRVLAASLVPLAHAYEEAMLDGFSREDVLIFKRLLIRAFDNLERHANGQDDRMPPPSGGEPIDSGARPGPGE